MFVAVKLQTNMVFESPGQYSHQVKLIPVRNAEGAKIVDGLREIPSCPSLLTLCATCLNETSHGSLRLAIALSLVGILSIVNEWTIAQLR